MASTDRMAAGVPSAVSTLAVPSIMKLFEVGRDPMMLIALPTPCRMAALFTADFHGAGAQEQELDEIAAVQRQLGDLPRGDGLADAGAAGVERDRGGLHLHRLGHVAGLELAGRRAGSESTVSWTSERTAILNPVCSAVTT